MSDAILLSLTIVTSASLVVLGCLAIFAAMSREHAHPEIAFGQGDQDAVFIFRESEMIDCSDQGRKLLDMLGEAGATTRRSAIWARLRAYLDPRFPELEQALKGLAGTGQAELQSSMDDGLVLGLRYRSGLTHLRLTDTSAEGALVAIDRLSFNALQNELRTLRHVARNVPSLIWKTEADGRVVWANSAYLKTLEQIRPKDAELTWPLPDLFGEDDSADKVRLALRQDEVVRWFAHSEAACDDQILHFAVPIDSAVQSEASRRETLQTLTRTFACLPIGLALFDAERRLQVFNPALIDLTGLEPLFLAARPSFEQVLYALRETRMLPEPKDFQNWRREIIEMEKAAETGEYAEEWCLDGGRIFYVTGRPQPNGAIALFIEDVTTEAALTRNFRNEIETAHHVLDALIDGIVVFGLAGQALLANDGYRQLWKTDPCADLADGGLAQAMALWSDACVPTTFWARLAEFVTRSDAREEISGSAALRTGIPLALRARRLAGGAVMVMFQPLAQGLSLQRPDLGLQGELIRRPDQAGLSSDRAEQSKASETAAQMLSPRKPRSARHSGSRIRV
jgi:PAS domain-containing protein